MAKKGPVSSEEEGVFQSEGGSAQGNGPLRCSARYTGNTADTRSLATGQPTWVLQAKGCFRLASATTSAEAELEASTAAVLALLGYY